MGQLEGLGFKWHKSAGDFTVAKFRDEYIVRQKRTKSATPERYFPQMVQRSKLGNTTNFYDCTDGLLKEAFVLDKPTSNAFAMFGKLNIHDSNVYLTQDEAKQGCTILAPYCVSSGKLQRIGITTQGQKQVSDICLGQLTIDASTTVSALAAAIIENNPGWGDHSRLTFVRAKQIPKQGEVQPKVSFKSVSVDLRIRQDSPTLWGYLGKSDGFETVTVDSLNYLACSLVADSMVAWTHSEIADDGTVVDCSYQRLTGSNSLLAQYTSDIALYYAILSYGGVNKENHYSPNYLSWKEFKLKVQKQLAGLAPAEGGPGTVHNVTVTCTVVGGNGTVNPASHTVAFGSTISFTAAPEPGYQPDWPGGSHALTYTLQALESQDIQLTFSSKSNGGSGNSGEDYGS